MSPLTQGLNYRSACDGLINTAFKAALGELHKKHPDCTKIRLFEIKNQKKILGRPPDPSPCGEGDTPYPHPTPLGAFGA